MKTRSILLSLVMFGLIPIAVSVNLGGCKPILRIIDPTFAATEATEAEKIRQLEEGFTIATARLEENQAIEIERAEILKRSEREQMDIRHELASLDLRVAQLVDLYTARDAQRDQTNSSRLAGLQRDEELAEESKATMLNWLGFGLSLAGGGGIGGAVGRMLGINLGHQQGQEEGLVAGRVEGVAKIAKVQAAEKRANPNFAAALSESGLKSKFALALAPAELDALKLNKDAA